MTAGMTAAQCSAALRLGAVGIFLKHGSPSALLQAILLVASGATWVDSSVLQQLAAQTNAEPTADRGVTIGMAIAPVQKMV